MASSSARGLRPHRELLTAWTLLLLDGGERHGYKLYPELRARGVDLQATSLYRWLRKFERDRWVASRWSDRVDGPERRVYVLTPEGRSTLRDVTALIAAMRETYSTFLHAHAQAVARRGNDPDGVDAAAAPAPGVGRTPTRDTTPSSASTTAQSLRPHKELLAGWLLLHLDAGATYGYDLRREFDAQRLSPDPTAMYRMLRRLEADGWVQSRWMRPRAGPRRRFYRLTTRGRRKLDEIARLIAAIRDSHDSYLQAYEHAERRHDSAVDNDHPSSR